MVSSKEQKKKDLVDAAHKEARGKWYWRVRIDFIRYYEKEGVPIVLGYYPIPDLIEVYTGETNQEFELTDKLTTNRGAYGAPSDSILYKILKNHRDGLYRLVMFKQTHGARMVNKKNTAFWGYCIIEKRRDQIFWRTRYFQSGHLTKWNMDRRDITEEIRRGHNSSIPSGGIDFYW